MYIVKKAIEPPSLKGEWNGPAWKEAGILEIARFRHEGSSQGGFEVLYESLVIPLAVIEVQTDKVVSSKLRHEASFLLLFLAV